MINKIYLSLTALAVFGLPLTQASAADLKGVATMNGKKYEISVHQNGSAVTGIEVNELKFADPDYLVQGQDSVIAQTGSLAADQKSVTKWTATVAFGTSAQPNLTVYKMENLGLVSNSELSSQDCSTFNAFIKLQSNTYPIVNGTLGDEVNQTVLAVCFDLN